MARILFLTDKFYPKIGGIETISEILATAFYEKGHEIHLVTWSKNSENDDFQKFPFKVLRMPTKRQLFKKFQWSEIIFENNPCLRLSWLNWFFKKPHVITLHTWISRVNGKITYKDELKLIWLRHATKVVACSTAIKKKCFNDAIVIENSYDDKVFKQLYGIEKTKDFVFLGRLVSDKGADISIRAFHQFLEKNQNDKKKHFLTIIGDGPERKNLERMVDELDIKDRVIFTGLQKEDSLARLLNQHHFMIVPSLWEEPFGIVVLEGMACGCLPIVSDGGGLPEAVGEAGITFESGNVNALASAMDSISNNPLLEKQLREKFNDHLERHHINKVVKKYLDIIESVSHL